MDLCDEVFKWLFGLWRGEFEHIIQNINILLFSVVTWEKGKGGVEALIQLIDKQHCKIIFQHLLKVIKGFSKQISPVLNYC